MPVTFTFDLSQQHFELRCGDQVRRLVQSELLKLVEDCEQCYYTGRPKNRRGQFYDLPEMLVELGQTLYNWLDGAEGWLRRLLAKEEPQIFIFDLIQSRETQSLNQDTDQISLRLAHLPWELLHDGKEFLLKQQALTMPPIRVVQQRRGQESTSEPPEPQNRPLHLLLMATSPDYPGIAELQYEQEETNILQATREQPLLSVVEESGSVQELGNLVRFYPQGYFDVFHLTGHGLIFSESEYGNVRARIQAAPIPDQTPCFVTEDELGGLQLTTAADLARAFGNRFPKLVFLSGCHTGEVPDRGSVPSMAQALVQAGVPLVLGWARPVYDTTAIVAAEALYKSLAAGDSVEAAIQATVAAMLQAECPDWHLLRVYRDSQPLAALVTPLRTPKREKLKPIQAEQEFLDEQDQVKVAGQYAFVGRRRALQRCLKALKETSDSVGVFIQGTGGLGKSTLAARLCQRVRSQRLTMQQVVLVGVLTQQTLLQKLSSKYQQFSQIPELLNQPGVSLQGRLQNFFEAIEVLDRSLLLEALSTEQRQVLAKLSVVRLPMTPEIVTALVGAVSLTPLLNLGLVESATSHSEPEYRVPTILEPLLQPVLAAADWQQTQQQAAQAVYRTWWEQSDSSTEEQGLEIVRLGELTQNAEITVTVGDALANHWINQSRFQEAQDLCQEILTHFSDYRILGTIARAEAVLGQVGAALEHYRQALVSCPEADMQERSATLGNMAEMIADQGDIEHAMQLWQQSLDLKERIGDVRGKATTLNNMAGVIEDQGDIEHAMQLYQQSLELKERIGDVRGKAITLGNMANIAAQQGETERAISLLQQCVQALGRTRAYVDLVTGLGNLAVIDADNRLSYLAQAIWLCLRIQAPLVDSVQLIRVLFNAVPQGDALEALLAATALWLCAVRGEGHPQLAQLQEDSFELLTIAANNQGIETQEAFEVWYRQQQLNDPNVFLPQLNQRLEELIGDGWLFDPQSAP